MGISIDFKALNAELLGHIESYCYDFIPEGKKRGKEWVAGTVAGGNGTSFSLNMANGLWSDFATGEKGGDLTSHYAHIKGLSQIDAAKELQSWLGNGSLPARKPLEKKPDKLQIGPPPEGVSKPEIEPRNGIPPTTWVYRAADGTPLFYESRWDQPDGTKTYGPTSYDHLSKSWVAKAYPEPRPLYNLPEVMDRENILLVEGPKAAEAARKIAGDVYAVTTWYGGCNAVEKTDFTPLYGKNVLGWPDHDPPGLKAMRRVFEKVNGHCTGLKLIIPPINTPVGFDAADALIEEWDYYQFVGWAKKNNENCLTVAIKEPVVEESSPPPKDITEPITVTLDEGFRPPPEQVIQMIEEADLDTNKQGIPAMNVANIVKLLAKFKPNLAFYDEFHNRIFDENGREWSDDRNVEILCLLQGGLKFHNLSLQTVELAVSRLAYMNKKNEPKNWLESLRWDGQQRIEDFAEKAFGCVPTAYAKALSKNFWISLAARIMDPGCKVDSMLVLEGPQGSLKSTALEIIGGKWFAELNESVNNKDFFLHLQGKILVEIAELDSFNRSEVNRIKSVITTRNDRIRMPYAKVAQDFARGCVFVGSTNEQNYLRDNTGARRFWPLKVNAINLGYIKEFREQLFAEARVMYQNGAKWWEMPKIETMAEQEFRRSHDEWEHIIHAHYEYHDDSLMGITVADIANDCLNIGKDKMDKRTQMRIANVLKVLGWEKRKKTWKVLWYRPKPLTGTTEDNTLEQDIQEEV